MYAGRRWNENAVLRLLETCGFKNGSVYVYRKAWQGKYNILYRLKIVNSNERIVLRIPKEKSVSNRIIDSEVLRKRVARELGDLIPKYQYYKEGSVIAPNGFMLYPEMQGIRLSAVSLKSNHTALYNEIMKALAKIHEIKINYESPNLFLHYSKILHDRVVDYRHRYNRFAKIIGRLPTGTSKLLSDYWKLLIDQVSEPSKDFSILHGDMYFNNILVTKAGGLAGIIDWDNLSIGDPAIDLCWLFNVCDAANAKSFLKPYFEYRGIHSREETEGFIERVSFYAALGRFYEMEYGIQVHDKQYFDAALDRLQDYLRSTIR